MCEDGGNCLKYLKRGWNRKEGRKNKYFKKGGGDLRQGVSALTRGEMDPSYELCLRNMPLKHHGLQNYKRRNWDPVKRL